MSEFMERFGNLTVGEAIALNEKNKRKAIIMQEDKEDEKYRRKIVK